MFKFILIIYLAYGNFPYILIFFLFTYGAVFPKSIKTTKNELFTIHLKLCFIIIKKYLCTYTIYMKQKDIIKPYFFVLTLIFLLLNFYLYLIKCSNNCIPIMLFLKNSTVKITK